MGNCCKTYADEISIEGSPRERPSTYSHGNPRENILLFGERNPRERLSAYRDENSRERLSMYGHGNPREGSSTYSHGNEREMSSSSKAGPSRSDLRVGRATSLDKGKGRMVVDQSNSSTGRPLLIDKQANRYIPLYAEDVGTSRQRTEYDYPGYYPGAGRVSEALKGEQIAAGWPSWFAEVGGEAIIGWLPKNPDTYERLEKIGEGAYSTVYRARDLEQGKIVALKKVKFDSYEPDSVRFMAREIHILRRLDHPNVIKLEGLVISRMSCSLYLIFEYMEHDLATLISCNSFKFSEPQIKCYMRQLLRGLDYCHRRGIMHRDIKGANLLVDDDGNLKIADFGLACFYHPGQPRHMTNRVVTLWYRSPELILGATKYSIGVDLWSAGCILAELYAGKPIMPGNTELDQMNLIFELCGSPLEENYWANPLLPYAKALRPRPPYKRRIAEVFQHYPAPAVRLIDTLLSMHPHARRTASHALRSEFFSSNPLPCGPEELPRYPPKRAIEAIIRDEMATRQIAEKNKGKIYDVEGAERTKSQANPQPDANAEFIFPVKKMEDQLNYSSGICNPHPEEASFSFPAIPPRPRGSYHQASTSMKHKESIPGFANENWRLHRAPDYTNYVSKGSSSFQCSDHHPYVQEAIRHARDEKGKREPVNLPTNALFIGPRAARSNNLKK